MWLQSGFASFCLVCHDHSLSIKSLLFYRSSPGVTDRSRLAASWQQEGPEDSPELPTQMLFPFSVHSGVLSSRKGKKNPIFLSLLIFPRTVVPHLQIQIFYFYFCLLFITHSNLNCLQWIFKSTLLNILFHRDTLDPHHFLRCHRDLLIPFPKLKSILPSL